jgi:cytoskeletal protein RodZ
MHQWYLKFVWTIIKLHLQLLFLYKNQFYLPIITPNYTANGAATTATTATAPTTTATAPTTTKTQTTANVAATTATATAPTTKTKTTTTTTVRGTGRAKGSATGRKEPGKWLLKKAWLLNKKFIFFVYPALKRKSGLS